MNICYFQENEFEIITAGMTWTTVSYLKSKKFKFGRNPKSDHDWMKKYKKKEEKS